MTVDWMTANTESSMELVLACILVLSFTGFTDGKQQYAEGSKLLNEEVYESRSSHPTSPLHRVGVADFRGQGARSEHRPSPKPW